jgi:outer membrane immunogenic protein
VPVAAPAMAADFPLNAPPYAPLYAAPPSLLSAGPVAIWAVIIGGSFVDKKFGGPFVDNAVPSTFGAPTSFAISDPSVDLNSTGLLGGGQVGCNFQFAANWVIGFEADASGANQQGGGCQPTDNGRGGPKRHFARHHNCG